MQQITLPDGRAPFLNPYTDMFYTLSMPCPKCGSRNHALTREDHCSMCGTFPKDHTPMVPESLVKSMEDCVCADCGSTFRRREGTNRRYCEICRTKRNQSRNNSTRKTVGYTTSKLNHDSTCSECGETIPAFEGHYLFHGDRWHWGCNPYTRFRRQNKRLPESGLVHAAV